MATIAEIFDLALRHYQSGQRSQSELLCRQILSADPSQPAVYHLLGILVQESGRPLEAIELIGRAIALSPTVSAFHYNLGLIHNEQKQWAEAAWCFGQALRTNPDHADSHHNLGIALFGQGKVAEAVACYRQAVRIDPNHMAALNNLALALVELRQLSEAAASYERALRLDQDNQAALFNRGLLHLMQGDFTGGWPGYELRGTWTGIVQRAFAVPRWDGAPLAGNTILVYAEQGLGDAIQFARYLPLVQRRGGRVILECPSALVELLTHVAGADQVIAAGAPLPSFEVHIPLLSLPGQHWHPFPRKSPT